MCQHAAVDRGRNEPGLFRPQSTAALKHACFLGRHACVSLTQGGACGWRRFALPWATMVCPFRAGADLTRTCNGKVNSLNQLIMLA